MQGMTDLAEMLRGLSPVLHAGALVFCSTRSTKPEDIEAAISVFREEEGITLVLPEAFAISRGYRFNGTFRRITLQVHSSLEAVGLTAAISKKLTEEGISANVIAAYYHDHVFVPADDATRALAALKSLAG